MSESFENRKNFMRRKRGRITFSAFMLEERSKAISRPLSVGNVSELRTAFLVLFRKVPWNEFLRFRVILRIVMIATHRDADSNS